MKNLLLLTLSVFLLIQANAQSWSEIQKIVASDRAIDSDFGVSVSISGNYAIVGARYEDHDENGLNYMSMAGSAYAFERDGGVTWSQVNKIVSSDR